MKFSINLSNISRIFSINTLLNNDIINIIINHTFKYFQFYSLYRRNDTFEEFSHVLCSSCSHICNYSSKFSDQNSSILTNIFRTHMNFKNVNIHYVLKIIFKNRVFVKNLHLFIICEFNKALKFDSSFGFRFEFEFHLISLLNNQSSLFYTINRCYFAQHFFKIDSIESALSHVKILIENHSEHLLKILWRFFIYEDNRLQSLNDRICYSTLNFMIIWNC